MIVVLQIVCVLESYFVGVWCVGENEGMLLLDVLIGELVVIIDVSGLDLDEVLVWGCGQGGVVFGVMFYYEWVLMLKIFVQVLMERKEFFYIESYVIGVI